MLLVRRRILEAEDCLELVRDYGRTSTMSFAPGHWPVVAISLGFLLSALVLLGLARRPGITCQQMLPVCSCLWKHSQARTSQFGGLTSSQWAIPDTLA